MAIEIGKKSGGVQEPVQAEASPLGERVFRIGRAVLLILILVTVAIFLWRNLTVERQLDSVKTATQAESAAQKGQDLQKFTQLQNQIKTFKELLSKHVFSSQVFEWLESKTHTQVSFTSFSADFTNNIISLNAQASSYQTMAEQLQAFKNDRNVRSVSTQSVENTPQGVRFNLVIEIDSNLYRQR